MATDIKGLADQFTSLPAWQESDNEGKRQLIRSFALENRSSGAPEYNDFVQELWTRQDVTNSETVSGYVGTGVKEALLSVPALAGATSLAVSDTLGVTDSGTGGRVGSGITTLFDQIGQRIKSVDPDDLQETRDAGLLALKADFDTGAAPKGVEDWLMGKPLEELDPQAQAYARSVTDALAESAVRADYGPAADQKAVERFRNSDRSLLYPGGQGRNSARELLADYVATKDPSSWSEFTSRATETDAENTKALRDQSAAAPFEAAASQDGAIDSLTRRAMGMQGSPLDLGTAVLPMLFGAKALAAAKAGNTAGALRTAATGIATGAAEEGATTFLTDADAPLSQIASDAGLGAIGEGAFTAAGAGAGALMRDRPIQQFVSDVPPAAPPPPAAVAEAIAVSTGDPAAAEVIRQAATVAETLSTVPQGEALRADLAAVDLSTPITDSYLGLDPLEVDALEVAPAEEVTEEITAPVVEDLSVEPTPDGGFVGEVLETPETPAESPLAEAGTTQDTTLVEPTAPVEGDVASVSGAQPLAETVAEPTPQDVEADDVITQLNTGTDYNLQRATDPDPDIVASAQVLEDMTGRKAVFVRGKPSVGGGARPGGTAVVINLNSKQPMRQLLGHEITHTLQGTPEYGQLIQAIQPSGNFAEYSQRLQKLGYAPEEVELEFVADTVGENLANRTFWRSLSETSPTLFQRVADIALDFLDNVWNKLKDSKRPSALAYVQDVKAARETIRKVLTGMRDSQRNTGRDSSASSSAQPVVAEEVAQEPKRTSVESTSPENVIPENQPNAGGENLGQTLDGVGTEAVTETAPQPVAEAAPTRVPLTEQTLRDRGADPDKWSAEARADAVAALNGDEVAFSRLSYPQKRVVGRVLLEIEDSVMESRSGPRLTSPQQRFGGQTTFQQEVIGVEEIQSVVDTLLENKTTIANAAEATKVLATLGSGATTRKVNAVIRAKFGDYLSKIKDADERANETDALRSFVYGATVGRVVDLAAKLQLKGGPSQKKTAAKLLALATDASRLTLVRGSLDSTTAARVLRFSQLANGGDVAALLAEINDQVFKFLEAKTGITPEQAERITKAGQRSKPAMAELAAYSVTPEGRKVIETRKKVQSQLDAFAKFLRSKAVKQSREEASSSVADRVDALVAAVREDYSKIEDVLQELATLLESLPLDQQVEAGQRFEAIMSADEDVAKAEVAAGGKSRKIDKIAERFIESVTAPPRDRKRKVSQDAADFAALRVQVREGTLSPDQAADAFEALGGNPDLVEKLTEAFAEDANNVIHEDALRQDAKESRAEIREAVAAVKQQKRIRRQALESAEAALERELREAEKKLVAASRIFGNQDVPRQSTTGGVPIETVVRSIMEEHPEWDVETPQGVLSIMTEAMNERQVPADIQQQAIKNSLDSFQNLLKKIRDKDAARADTQDQRDRDRLEQKERREETALARMFGNFDVPNRPNKLKSVGAIVAKIRKDTPGTDLGNLATREAILQEVLRQRGVSPEAFAKVEDTLRARFDDLLDTLVSKAALNAQKKGDRAAVAETKAATRVFGNFDVKKPGEKRGPSLSQTIMEVINSNPTWDISDPADKQKIIAEVLKGKGFDAATIAAAAKNAVDVFNTQLEKLQQQEGAKLIKEIKRGKVTQDSLFRAIRLNILSPEKGLPATLAAIEGWKGLSEQDLANLYEVGERARQVENQQVRVALLLDQLRIIYTSTGLAPETREILSAGIRASAYGGLGSIMTNFTAPVTVGAAQVLRELTVDVARSPLQAFEIIADQTESFLKAVQEGYRSAVIAFSTESTKAFNVSNDTAENAKKMEGLVNVDALTRLFDKNLATLRDPKASLLSKTRAGFELVWSSQRIVWKVLGAADSFAISSIQKHLTTLNLYREIRKSGDRPSDSRAQFDIFYGGQESAVRHAVTQLGLSPIAARLEAETRVESAYYQWLRQNTPGIEPDVIRQEALREAVSMLGNHSEVQGRLSFVVNKAVDFFSSREWAGLGPLISGPIRIIGNIADMAMWYMPVYGIYRGMREKARHVRDAEKGLKPGEAGSESKFTLHALTDYQLQRRNNEGIAGSIFSLGLMALLTMQPDDPEEKVFEVTTAYPAFDPKEQARWKDHNIKEYSIYIGKGKDRLAVAYTRGAFDFLTFPLAVASRSARMIRGETTATKSVAGLAYDVLNLSVPTTTNNARNLNTLSQGGDFLKDVVLSRLSALQPYSGLTRSIAKVTEESLDKQASGFQWSVVAPVTALISDEGEVTLRNVLNEEVSLNDTWWKKLAASGFPIYVSSKSEREDPEIRKAFSSMNYILPSGYTYKNLETDVEGREAEVLKLNGARSLPELFQKMNAYRATVFKETFKDDPKPGKEADDQRYMEDILQDRTPEGQEAFKKRMAVWWTKATNETKEEFQIREDK